MLNNGLEKSYADVNSFPNKVINIQNKKSLFFLTKIFYTGILKDRIIQSWDTSTLRTGS